MRYGKWGKHIELFEIFESWRQDPAVQEKLETLQEGTGAPEGRADFTLFLASTIRHRMREGYKTVAAKWEQYVGIERAEDFRPHTMSQLNAIAGIEPVNEDGEYVRLRTGEEEGPSYAVARYGGIYSITYELIINDETNRILNTTPRKLGEAFAAYVSQVVVALIESNPTAYDGTAFFHSTRDNIATTTAAVPSEDNLAAITSKMMLRRNSDGLPIAIEASKIVTQSNINKLIFNRILNSQLTGTRTNDSDSDVFDKGTDNPLAGIIANDAVITEPYMNDPNDWIVFAEPADHPAFIVAFLRDQRTPFIGLKDPQVTSAFGNGRDPYTFENDNIDFKTRHVFGAGPGDPLSAFLASQA